MIKPIRMLLKVLQGNVILDDGTIVRVIKRDYPLDKTPCITIDDSGGTAIINKHIMDKDYVFPIDHPQYKIPLSEILAGYDYVVADMTYSHKTKDWKYTTIPVNEITYLSDLDNCIMNLTKTGDDIEFERYSNNDDVEVLTRAQQEGLLGLLVGIIYDDYTVKYTSICDRRPIQTISQQVIREQRTIDLGLHVWCDDENQRDEITEKISTLFYQVQSDHYRFCANYNNGNCIFLNESCRVNQHSARGIKNQCPKPYDYHYQNIFTSFDIIRATFDVAPPYILDDTTTNPPVLRSIIRVSFSYYEYYLIGGAVSENLLVNEDLL